MDLTKVRQKMEQALQVLANDLAMIKTGRADPSLIERIMVEAYETLTPLTELATVGAVSANQLLITPFDQMIIKNIERALNLDRNLGLSVSVDGNVIRVNIPPLTEERRQEFVKILQQKLEAGKVMVRQIRHDQMAHLKRQGEAKEINEDERFRAQEELQKLTDEFNERIEEMGEKKKTELLSI